MQLFVSVPTLLHSFLTCFYLEPVFVCPLTHPRLCYPLLTALFVVLLMMPMKVKRLVSVLCLFQSFLRYLSIT